jgi:hypothetical protein
MMAVADELAQLKNAIETVRILPRLAAILLLGPAACFRAGQYSPHDCPVSPDRQPCCWKKL